MRVDIPERATSIAHFLRAMSLADNDRAAAHALVHRLGLPEPIERAVVSQLKAGAGDVSGDVLTGGAAYHLAELSRPLTIVERLPGVKRAPFHARLVGMTAAASGSWVAPGAAIPMQGRTFSQPSALSRKKIGAIAVATDETLRDSDPELQRTLIGDLRDAVVEACDAKFIDVGNTGGDEVPASITSGGASTASTGTSLAQIDTDLSGLVDDLIDAKSNLLNAAWVLHPRSAVFLSKLRGTGGSLAHPNVSVAGGTLLGLPVLVSAGVPMSTDTNALTQISLVDGSGVLLAGDGDAELYLTRNASLEMDTEPSGNTITPTAASASRAGLFRANAAAIRAIRCMTWLPRRTAVASTLTGVSY